VGTGAEFTGIPPGPAASDCVIFAPSGRTISKLFGDMSVFGGLDALVIPYISITRMLPPSASRRMTSTDCETLSNVSAASKTSTLTEVVPGGAAL